MFSAALNLAPSAASSLASAARGVGGSSNNPAGTTGGGIGSGLGGMSFMSPLTDAKNTMEKRLGNVAGGTINKQDPSNLDLRNTQAPMSRPPGVNSMSSGLRPHRPNFNQQLSTANRQPFGGVPVLPVATTGIKQPNNPVQTTSTIRYNNANQFNVQVQNNAQPNVLNNALSNQPFNALSVSGQQPISSAGGVPSSSMVNAQSKRCRFASTTSSVGNESIEVPLTGKEDRLSSNTYQNASMSSMVQPSDTSNILGGTRRSRSPGPKPTSHLMGNLNYNNSGNFPHHMIQNQDSARIVKSNQPYSSQPLATICSTNTRENQSTLISSSHSSYPIGNSMASIANLNATALNQNPAKQKGNLSSDPTKMSSSLSLNQKIRGYDDSSLKKEGIKFSAPLMMEQAEELMILASTEKPLPEGLQIRDNPPLRPNGGTMYLIRTSNPSSKDANGVCSDGYPWVEILYQADLTTPRGNCIDYRHYYIGSHIVPGASHTNALKTRTSSRFRREAYTLGNLTLFAYIGDEREGSGIVTAAGSRASSVNTNRDHTDLFNSLPRSHRYDKIGTGKQTHIIDPASIPSVSSGIRLNSAMGERSSRKTNIYGPNINQGVIDQGGGSLLSRVPSASLRPRSLDRNDILHQRSQKLTNSDIDNLDLHRLQTRTSSAADMSKSGMTNAYGSSLSSALISSSLRSSTLLAKANNYQGTSTKTAFEELAVLAEELAGGKLVKNLTLFPSIQITLVHPDMTREFEQSCQVLYADHPDPSYLGLEEGILLFYDITFPLGRIHATLLTYINCCYEGNPVMPLAVNLHERKFKSSHQLFWARIVGDIPALQKYRFPLMIDDAEPAVHLAVRTQAPNLVQLEGWTHRFRDIDRHLRSKGYGEEAVSYYKACIGYLLSANSKQAMHDRYRKEFECVWPKDFVHYYRNKLLPRSGRLGRWAMSKMNIKEQQYFSPHTNPQERFHMLCRNFSGWETMTVDQLVRCFYLLFVFFVSETTSGNGSSTSAYVIKSTFRPFFLQMTPRRTHSNYLTNTLHPADIREYVLSNYPKEISSKRPLDPLRPFYLASSSAEHGGIKHHAGIEDVLQLGDALENMLYDEDDIDPLYNAHKLYTDEIDSAGLDLSLSSLLNSQGFSNRDGGIGNRSTARFLSNGNLPSSAIGNVTRHHQVPSPAPNGRVPSPAPGDAAMASYGTLPSASFSQANFLGNTTSVTSSTGSVTVPMRSTHSSLSTIPEVPAEVNKSYSSNSVIKHNKNSQPPPSTEAPGVSKSSRQPLMSQPNQKRTMFQQSNRFHPSMSNTIGGGIIRGVHPSTDKFHTSGAARFGVPTTGQSLDTMNNYPPDILVHSTTASVGPSTSVSSALPISTNPWQEQSFESSIVTESHYDASFESEIPPMGLSIDRASGQNGANNDDGLPINQSNNGVVTSMEAGVSNTAPLTTSQRQQKNVFQQRKAGGALSQNSILGNDQHEKNKAATSKAGGIFGITGFGNNSSQETMPNSRGMQVTSQNMAGTNKVATALAPMSNPMPSNNANQPMVGGIRPTASSNVAPNNLMLWKKVQHYVVVGGAFVQAGQQASHSEGNTGSNLQQHHSGNTAVVENPTTMQYH